MKKADRNRLKEAVMGASLGLVLGTAIMVTWLLICSWLFSHLTCTVTWN